MNNTEQPQKVYNNCHIFESGSINIEHVEHFHQAEGVKPAPKLPDALNTPKAKALLAKAQDAGLLDANFQYIGEKSRAAVLADEIAAQLELKPRWSPFEELWGVTNLRQTLYSANGTEKGGGVRDEIRKILK